MSKYDIELDELRLDIDEVSRDNIKAIRQAMDNLQAFLDDIDTRLKALE